MSHSFCDYLIVDFLPFLNGHIAGYIDPRRGVPYAFDLQFFHSRDIRTVEHLWKYLNRDSSKFLMESKLSMNEFSVMLKYLNQITE